MRSQRRAPRFYQICTALHPRSTGIGHAAGTPVAPAPEPGKEILMAYHYRAAAIILALGLTVGVPAAAAAQQSATPGSPATASPCSEACSGGGYGSGTGSTGLNYSLPTILNYAGNPAPCSEVCSGRGYDFASQPSLDAG